jgi:hypothetical protein
MNSTGAVLCVKRLSGRTMDKITTHGPLASLRFNLSPIYPAGINSRALWRLSP